MAGYSSPHMTYFHVIGHGFDISRLFDLPHDLGGEHQAAINRLMQDGIIRKIGWQRIRRQKRNIWAEGPRFPTFKAWCERRGKI